MKHDLSHAQDLHTAGLSLDELEDDALLDLTRRGSTEAYAVIYERYVYAARRLARHLGQREESDDVVSESFAQVLSLLQRGKGPDRAFRAYLFTTIRHESGRRAKAGKRVMPTDDDAKIDSAVPFGNGALDDFEKQAIRAAYESLPDRWRTVLWHLDVEGRKPHELADVMGLKPNSVSALVYRARSGLREAYLKQHLSTTDDTADRACVETRGLLAAVLRRTATGRDQEKVHAHLESCADCVAVYLDLKEVNREVGTVTVAAAVAVVGGGSAVAVASSGGAVVAHLLGGVKGLLVAAAVPAAAAAVTGVAVVSVTSGTPAVDDVTSPTAKSVVVRKPDVVALAPAASAPSASTPTVRRQHTSTALPTPSAGDAAAPDTTHRAPAPEPTPTDPTPSFEAGLGLPGKPVEVVAAPDALEVKIGDVVVSTKPVTDLVKKVLPRTSAALRGILAPAPAAGTAPAVGTE